MKAVVDIGKNGATKKNGGRSLFLWAERGTPADTALDPYRSAEF
jgi:hypothetical protein